MEITESVTVEQAHVDKTRGLSGVLGLRVKKWCPDRAG